MPLGLSRQIVRTLINRQMAYPLADPLNYHLSFPDLNESMNIRKRRCKRGEWASAAAEAEEVDEEGVPMVEGDQGGWRWEWC